MNMEPAKKGQEMKSVNDQINSINKTLGDVRSGSAGFIMPFGKHKGKDLSDIPLYYIRWLTMNVFDDYVLVEQCEQEIERRN